MARQAATIPIQAYPPDKRPRTAPDPFVETLPSGLEVAWRQADIMQVIAFDGTLPDPWTAAAINLLKDERSYTAEDDPLKFRTDANSIKGMLAITAHMLVKPTYDPTLEYGEGDVLGRRELAYMDICAMYWRFRVRTRIPARAPAATDQSEPS